MSYEIFRLTHRALVDQLAGIPGPQPSFPLGNATDFSKGWPWETCAEYARRFGGMTLVWFMGNPAIVLNDPELIAEVLIKNTDDYYKDAPGDALAPVITAENMFVVNGAKWRAEREASPFSLPNFRSWLGTQLGPMRQAIIDGVDRAVGQPIDCLVECLRKISYEAFSVVVWGRKLGPDSYAQFAELASTGSHRMTELPPLQKIPPLNPLFYVTRKRWYDTFEGLVRDAMDHPNPKATDLLHFALRSGTRLDVPQLANHLSVPVYFGGVYGPSSTLPTTLLFLARNPKLLEAIRRELDERQPLSPSFDIAALESCEKLDHAIRESMRLMPPVPLFFRSTCQEHDVELGGHTLPANTPIFISNWFLHRDPKHWTNPSDYRPERWADGGVQRDPLGSGHYFPFGRGPRTCIGQSFAMFYMRLALAVLLTRRKVVVDPAQTYNTDYFFAVQHPKQLKAQILNW